MSDSSFTSDAARAVIVALAAAALGLGSWACDGGCVRHTDCASPTMCILGTCQIPPPPADADVDGLDADIAPDADLDSQDSDVAHDADLDSQDSDVAHDADLDSQDSDVAHDADLDSQDSDVASDADLDAELEGGLDADHDHDLDHDLDLDTPNPDADPPVDAGP